MSSQLPFLKCNVSILVCRFAIQISSYLKYEVKNRTILEIALGNVLQIQKYILIVVKKLKNYLWMINELILML